MGRFLLNKYFYFLRNRMMRFHQKVTEMLPFTNKWSGSSIVTTYLKDHFRALASLEICTIILVNQYRAIHSIGC